MSCQEKIRNAYVGAGSAVQRHARALEIAAAADRQIAELQAKLLDAASYQLVWRSMDTAPKDGTRFIAWRVEQIGNDRHFSCVTARWNGEMFVWFGGKGILNAWTDHPPRQFNCAHFAEEIVVNDVITCGECGAMLEDLAPQKEHPFIGVVTAAGGRKSRC